MTRPELAKRVFEISHLTGQFLLRSGKTSNEYFDKYRFESDPVILREIARGLVSLVPKDTDYFGALEMGGIHIATALSLETGIPVVFVRKEAKEYGTCKFAEGPAIKGKRLTLVEDVITTGGQVVISTNDLRSEGAIIENVLCVIDRSEGQTQKIKEAGLNLKPLFTMADLKAHL
ncbi:MAG TPA: orotate phosphoribosyltransferase [Bdellovibrionales bacterium]|nr:orotate phosphoribosyltransferase [Bdellovibrionales bacterium]